MKSARPKVTGRRIALSIEDVMEEGGFCRDFIYSEIRKGRLIAQKAGRRTIILRPNWQHYLETRPRMVAAEAEAAS